MRKHRYTVEFRIFGKMLDPASISRELELQPCQVRAQGTIRSDEKPSLAVWAYSGTREGVTEWDALEDGLTHVLDNLWAHRQRIAKYKASGHSLIWWCGHFQE